MRAFSPACHQTSSFRTACLQPSKPSAFKPSERFALRLQAFSPACSQPSILRLDCSQPSSLQHGLLSDSKPSAGFALSIQAFSKVCSQTPSLQPGLLFFDFKLQQSMHLHHLRKPAPQWPQWLLPTSAWCTNEFLARRLKQDKHGECLRHDPIPVLQACWCLHLNKQVNIQAAPAGRGINKDITL